MNISGCFRFLALASFSLSASGLAGPIVEFENTVVSVEARPDQDSVPIDFKFKVKGDAPLIIADLEIGCKCLHASATQKEYKPGESGEIKTVMDVGAFEGEVSKFVTLISNDSVTPSLPLRAVVRVPAVIVFDPLITSWTVGDPATTKKISVKIVHTDPINILKVASTRPNFTHDVKVIKPGREYEILITPQDTASPALGLLTVETDCKIAKFAKRQTFFNIVRSSRAAEQVPTPAK